MVSLIEDGVNHGQWSSIKIIKNKEIRCQAALHLLKIINSMSMQGDSIEAINNQNQWLAIYETHVCWAVNKQHSSVQSVRYSHMERRIHD